MYDYIHGTHLNMGNKYNYANNLYDVIQNPLHSYSYSTVSAIESICCVNSLWLLVAIIVVVANYNSIQMRLLIGLCIYFPSVIYNHFSIKKICIINTVLKNGDRYSGEILSYHISTTSRKGIKRYIYSIEVSYDKRKRVVSERYTDNHCYCLANTKCNVYIYHDKCFVSDFVLRSENDPFSNIHEK